jgi:hypothetical protein
MSSIHRGPSQVAPLKRWVVGASATGRLYSATNGTTVVSTPAAGSVLADMGKTVYLASGAVLRKVQVLPASSSGVTGYIHLGGASTGVPAAQNITSLN